MNSSILFNPFDEDIVTEPRHREPVVPGLNERPFRELLKAFARLDQEPAPRTMSRVPHAVLLTSPQPGYGKSHLVGRLLRELHGRATFVYLRPFRNPLLPFQSVLSAMVRELHFPDRLETTSFDASDPTQLDLFAHAVFGHLVADLIGRNLDSADPEGDATMLREAPAKAFGFGSPRHAWANWMREHFETLIPLFENNLNRSGLALNSTGILRALYKYAYADFDRDTRKACLDWLAGHPLDGEIARTLGFRPSDLPEAEMPSQERNETCRQRLLDLCVLAGFFRPFVLCFDQTEVYGHHSDLARSFGMVVSSLVNEATNQFTLVTSNQDPWRKSVSPEIEEADLNRFAPPLSLEGLNQEQGAELARLRLESWQVDSAEIGAFLSPVWLDAEFPSPIDQKGARSFLRICRAQWERSQGQSQEKTPAEPSSLEDFYTQRRESLLTKPKRRLFDADILQWLVADAAYGLKGLNVLTNPSGTFPVLWESADRKVGFVFEDTAHPRRWSRIAKTATHRAGTTGAFKTICFRTPELELLAGDAKDAEEVTVARKGPLHIVELRDGDLAELYAGYDLYADALQGNIPFSDRDVVTFLHKRFATWWTLFSEPAPAHEPEKAFVGPGSPSALPDRVRTIVRRAKSISVNEALEELSHGASHDTLLNACGHIPQIEVHALPDGVVLRWQE